MTRVFDEEWFDQHQDVLLWFLNARPTRRAARRFFRIARHDLPLDEDVSQIGPNCFSRGDLVLPDGSLSRTTDFRVNDKFALRLRRGLHPLWRAAHGWDALVANQLAPALNLGFDTFYPDGVPVTTCNGIMERNFGEESWAAIQGAGGATFVTTYNGASSTLVSLFADAYASPYEYSFLQRADALFDTHAIGAGATVTSATLSWYGAGSTFDSYAASVDVYASSPASNTSLAFGDYSRVGSAAFCDSPIALASWSTSGYNNFSFNSTGKAAVNVAGITKTCVRLTCDANNVPPTWTHGQSSVDAWFATTGGHAKDPKLVVSYTTTPPPGAAFLLRMVRRR